MQAGRLWLAIFGAHTCTLMSTLAHSCANCSRSVRACPYVAHEICTCLHFTRVQHTYTHAHPYAHHHPRTLWLMHTQPTCMGARARLHAHMRNPALTRFLWLMYTVSSVRYISQVLFASLRSSCKGDRQVMGMPCLHCSKAPA